MEHDHDQTEQPDVLGREDMGANSVPTAEVDVVGMPQTWDRRSGLYALAQPFVGGRRVLDLWSHLAGDGVHLLLAGAAEATALSPNVPSLPMADGSADLVICANGLPGMGNHGDVDAPDDGSRHEWMAEIARVLAPNGVCLMRSPLLDVDGAGPGPGVAGRHSWLSEESFPEVAVVEELAFGGVSFRVPATEDLAIVGDLSPLSAPADFEILLCGRSPGSLPDMTESLLVPLPGFPRDDGSLAPAQNDLDAAYAALAESERARGEEQLAAAARADRDDGSTGTVATLRATAQRQLQRLADLEAALLRVTSERDEATGRSTAAEARLSDTETALRRREWENEALRRDLARIGRPPDEAG